MNCFGEIRETKFVFARERGNTCVTNATGFAPLFLCFRLPRNYSHAGEKKDYLKVAAGRSPREREHLHNNMVKSPSKNGVKKLFALAATDTIAPCTTVHDDADEIIVAVYPTFNQEGTANSSVKRSASSIGWNWRRRYQKLRSVRRPRLPSSFCNGRVVSHKEQRSPKSGIQAMSDTSKIIHF